YYHPCEFVHKEFWDAANFRNGANPPRAEWKLPGQKSDEESKVAYEVFENYVHFMKRFPDVKFITAAQAGRVYRDPAQGRKFNADELRAIAKAVNENVLFQRHADLALSASEVFLLLNNYVAFERAEVTLTAAPLGPTQPTIALGSPVETDANQFLRSARDV